MLPLPISSILSVSFKFTITFLRLLPCLRVTSMLSFTFLYTWYFKKAAPTKDVTSPLRLPSFILCRIFLSSCNQSNVFFIFYTIGPTDLLHPSPAPHFKNFQIILIHFLKCPICSTTQSYAPNVALYWFHPSIKHILLVKRVSLVVGCCLCHGNLDLVSSVTVAMFN